jgi:hypothetical protein
MGKSELLKNLLRVDVRRAGDGREAVIEGERWRVPDLPSPDEMVQVSKPVPNAKPPETASNDELLARLLGLVSGSLKRETAEDDKPVSAVSTRNEKLPQTADAGNEKLPQTADAGNEKLPQTADTDGWDSREAVYPLKLPETTHQTIRQMAAEGSSKNTIYRWLADTHSIRNKKAAMELINSALNGDDDEPPAAFRAI